jgi:hypothetical protein
VARKQHKEKLTYLLRGQLVAAAGVVMPRRSRARKKGQDNSDSEIEVERAAFAPRSRIEEDESQGPLTANVLSELQVCSSNQPCGAQLAVLHGLHDTLPAVLHGLHNTLPANAVWQHRPA